jgi:hypothetical protein
VRPCSFAAGYRRYRRTSEWNRPSDMVTKRLSRCLMPLPGYRGAKHRNWWYSSHHADKGRGNCHIAHHISWVQCARISS